MEKFTSTGRLISKNVFLHRVKGDRNILHTVWRRKATWIGYSLRSNCRLKHVFEGKIQRREDEEQDVSSYCVCLILCDILTSTIRWPRPDWGCWTPGKYQQFRQNLHEESHTYLRVGGRGGFFISHIFDIYSQILAKCGTSNFENFANNSAGKPAVLLSYT